MKHLMILITLVMSACSTTSEFHRGCVAGIEEAVKVDNSCDYECQQEFVEKHEEEVMSFCSEVEAEDIKKTLTKSEEALKRSENGSRNRRR